MQKEKKEKEDRSYLWHALNVALLVLIIAQFCIHPVTVSGVSMDPTYHDGDILCTSPIHGEHDLDKIEREDVIVFDSENKNHDNYVKRVIGLPGETIQINEYGIFINGVLYNDKQRRPTSYGKAATPIVLGEDEYFVLGDNRPVSLDSRRLGPVKKDQIVSRVKCKLPDIFN